MVAGNYDVDGGGEAGLAGVGVGNEGR